jgi:hypothetical protein
MSAPGNYHEIPAPSPKTSATIRNTPSAFSLRRIAELWRPDGGRLETLLATLARVSLRLVDRKTGIAYSADELEAKILGQTGSDEDDDSGKFVQILDESPISEQLEVSGSLTFNGSPITIPLLLPSGPKQWTNTGEAFDNLVNGWALFFNEGTHWDIQKIQNGSAVAIWSGANAVTPAMAGGYHPLGGGPYAVTGTATVTQPGGPADHLLQFAVLNDGSELYACTHMDPIRWLRIDRSDGSELLGVYARLQEANTWTSGSTFNGSANFNGDVFFSGSIGSEISPKTDAMWGIGNAGKRFKDGWFSGLLNAGDVSYNGQLTITNPLYPSTNGVTIAPPDVDGMAHLTWPAHDGQIALTRDITGTNTGTNTGDNSVNSRYSGLVSNATHTGDVTGSTTLTLATVNGNVGSFGSATATPTYTVNAKGLITASGSATITPAVTSITGLGTGVSTLLGGTSSGTGGIAGTVSPTFTGQSTITGATFPVLNTVRTSTVTNSPLGTLAVTHSTTGDAADGFGPSLFFQLTDNGVSNSLLGSVGAIRSGSDTTGAIIFSPANGGGTSEKVRISPTGNMLIGSSNGTSSSSKFLHIQDASSAGITMERTGATAGKWSFFTKGTGGDFGFYDELSNRFSLNFRRSDGVVETPSGIASAGQVEFTGQVSANSTSAMTRSLMFKEQMLQVGTYRPIHISAGDLNSSGAPGAANINDNLGVNLLGSTTASAWQRAGLCRVMTGNPGSSGAASNAAIPLAIAFNAFAYLEASVNSEILCVVGEAGSGTPIALGLNPLTARGFGFRIYWSTANSRREIEVFTHDGTTYTHSNSSAAVAFNSNSAVIDQLCSFLLVSNANGTVKLFANAGVANGGGTRISETPLITWTGGPTAGNYGGQFISVYLRNGATGPTVLPQCKILNAAIQTGETY